MTNIINYTKPGVRCDKSLESCKGCHDKWVCQRQRALIEMYGSSTDNRVTGAVNKVDRMV